MIISIRDIPHEGQNFEFHEGATHVKGFIYPLKGGFDVSGDILSEIDTECSFCAGPVKIPVSEKFHEIMMIGGKVVRQLKEVDVHPNELEIHCISGNEIDLAPIVKELVELNMPIQPKCTSETTKDGHPACIEGTAYQKYLLENPKEPLKNPFEVLKTLKKN